MLLRISYWVGAVVDFLAAIQLMLPTSVTVVGFKGMRPFGAGAQPALMAAVLMLGFTALLLWADRQPFERRAVLGVTLMVVVGFVLSEMWVGFTGARPWADMLPMFMVQVVLIVLFGIALTTAKQEHHRRPVLRLPR